MGQSLFPLSAWLAESAFYQDPWNVPGLIARLSILMLVLI